MENMWSTTPTEELLILLFVFCFVFAVIFFLFAIMYTVNAILGKYSRTSIGIYWSYVTVCILLVFLRDALVAILFFAYAAPVAAFFMRVFERERIKLSKSENNG